MGENKKTASSTKSNEDNVQANSEGAADLGTAVADAGEQVQQQVVDLTQQVRQQASDQITTQKDRLADTLETVALLLHQASEHADLQDKAGLAGYVTKASGQVEQWSESLRERDASQLMDETVQFAKRQPVAFLSGALALGFAGARFLRSSAQQVEAPTTSANGSGSTSAEAPDLARNELFFNADEVDHVTQSDIDGVLQGDQDIDHPGLTGVDPTAGLEGDPLIDDSMAGETDVLSTERQ
jgi:hypothetical protein